MLAGKDIRAFAERKYYDALRSVVAAETLFPLKIRFGKPSPTADFAQLRNEVESLANSNFGFSIQWEEKNTRLWGKQRLPTQVLFDSEDQFFSAIQKTKEVEAFKTNIKATLDAFPDARPWLISHVRWVVEFSEAWPGIIAVGAYFLKSPRPNLFVRQLPIPVHTKFIEEHREVINSLLLAILPREHISPQAYSFEDRYGLKKIQPLVRFRLLDPGLVARFNFPDDELGLRLDRFARLPIEGLNIVITENLMTLVCLPAIVGGIGIWGQGNAADLLSGIGWLDRCRVLYWGDIDEHGFHILARLRKALPEVRSVMMNLQTVTDLKDLVGKGEPAGQPPVNLTVEERAAYDVIREKNGRLEQEKIPLHYSIRMIGAHFPFCDAVSNLVLSGAPAACASHSVNTATGAGLRDPCRGSSGLADSL
jgi:hypothetical protein